MVSQDDVVNSDYGPGLLKFKKSVKKSVKGAMESDELARKVFEVFIKKNPKTRYTFLNKKFANYTIPRYLISSRRFDSFVKKMFF